MKSIINCPVSMTAIAFTKRMQPVPKRMEWNGQIYHFIGRGVHVTARRGNSHWSTITMSDGIQQFRLRYAGNTWTLLGVV